MQGAAIEQRCEQGGVNRGAGGGDRAAGHLRDEDERGEVSGGGAEGGEPERSVEELVQPPPQKDGEGGEAVREAVEACGEEDRVGDAKREALAHAEGTGARRLP